MLQCERVSAYVERPSQRPLSVATVLIFEHLFEAVDHEGEQVWTSDALREKILAEVYHALALVQAALLQNTAAKIRCNQRALVQNKTKKNVMSIYTSALPSHVAPGTFVVGCFADVLLSIAE